MSSAARKINATHSSCEVPQPLGGLKNIDLRVAYSDDVKLMSISRFRLTIIDTCIPGFYCTDTFHECPQGHYCSGDLLVS